MKIDSVNTFTCRNRVDKTTNIRDSNNNSVNSVWIKLNFIDRLMMGKFKLKLKRISSYYQPLVSLQITLKKKNQFSSYTLNFVDNLFVDNCIFYIIDIRVHFYGNPSNFFTLSSKNDRVFFAHFLPTVSRHVTDLSYYHRNSLDMHWILLLSF